MVDRPEPDGPGPQEPEPDPLTAILRALTGMSGDPTGADLSRLPEQFRQLPGGGVFGPEMLGQLQRMLASGGDAPVNWELAHDLARTAAASAGDPSVGEAQQRQVAEALRTADLWLDPVTTLSSATARTDAWSRAEWIEETLPTWRAMVEPVATRVAETMGEVLGGQVPEQFKPLLGSMLPMMRQLGGAFFGAQLGQALGQLAHEVVGGGDIGLPLLPTGRAVLVPANVTAFGAGLGLPEDEVRLYLALREAAHARLLAGAGWLRSHLVDAVAEYARGITVDADRLEEAVGRVDPTDPQALQEALSSGLFAPQTTPAQQAALDRLETSLALVEGWITAVVADAARGVLPHADALQEAVRRRRAAGGPAEQTLTALVGLELRPRRMREAGQVWAELARQRGIEARDALWAHPDLMPTEAAFADPAGFAAPPEAGADTALDDALRALLDDEGPA